MPGLKLYKLRFRGMLHVGQLARFGTVCFGEYSVPHLAAWPSFIVGSGHPRFSAFYERLSRAQASFPPYPCPHRETVTNTSSTVSRAGSRNSLLICDEKTSDSLITWRTGPSTTT